MHGSRYQNKKGLLLFYGGTKQHIDSGASQHMTNRREWLITLEEFSTLLVVLVSNGQHMEFVGKIYLMVKF